LIICGIDSLILEWIKENKHIPRFSAAKSEEELILFNRLSNYRCARNGGDTTMTWKIEYNKLINKFKQQKHFKGQIK